MDGASDHTMSGPKSNHLLLALLCLSHSPSPLPRLYLEQGKTTTLNRNLEKTEPMSRNDAGLG